MASAGRGQRIAVISGVFLVVWGLCCFVPARRAEDRPALSGPELRIAHRCGTPPEATLEACRVTAPQADILEMDVHITKDNHVVVIHDETVDRTTDGTGPVSGFTLAEIQRLDAGYRYTRDGIFPFRGKGIRIREVREFFEEFPGHRFYIEIKSKRPDAAAHLIEVVRRKKMTDRVILASVDESVMRQVETIAPEIARAASLRESIWWILAAKTGTRGFVDFRSHALALPPLGGRCIVTDSVIEKAREQNIRIHMWTINKPDDMQTWLEARVDGIMTDDVPLLNRVIAGDR